MTLPPPPDVRGFLSNAEGWHLHELAHYAAPIGSLLEIGSYCGRSTIWLGTAAKAHGSVVFALDHHRGSEEHQPGEMFHDHALVDERGCVDTLREFRRNIARAGLDDTVIGVVASTAMVALYWRPDQLGMVFIDGGHSLEAALADWRAFGTKVSPGGILAIHDVFPDPAEGGQAPFTLWRMALASGLFEEYSHCQSLRALKRI